MYFQNYTTALPTYLHTMSDRIYQIIYLSSTLIWLFTSCITACAIICGGRLNKPRGAGTLLAAAIMTDCCMLAHRFTSGLELLLRAPQSRGTGSHTSAMLLAFGTASFNQQFNVLLQSMCLFTCTLLPLEHGCVWRWRHIRLALALALAVSFGANLHLFGMGRTALNAHHQTRSGGGLGSDSRLASIIDLHYVGNLLRHSYLLPGAVLFTSTISLALNIAIACSRISSKFKAGFGSKRTAGASKLWTFTLLHWVLLSMTLLYLIVTLLATFREYHSITYYDHLAAVVIEVQCRTTAPYLLVASKSVRRSCMRLITCSMPPRPLAHSHAHSHSHGCGHADHSFLVEQDDYNVRGNELVMRNPRTDRLQSDHTLGVPSKATAAPLASPDPTCTLFTPTPSALLQNNHKEPTGTSDTTELVPCYTCTSNKESPTCNEVGLSDAFDLADADTSQVHDTRADCR